MSLVTKWWPTCRSVISYFDRGNILTGPNNWGQKKKNWRRKQFFFLLIYRLIMNLMVKKTLQVIDKYLNSSKLFWWHSDGTLSELSEQLMRTSKTLISGDLDSKFINGNTVSGIASPGFWVLKPLPLIF